MEVELLLISLFQAHQCEAFWVRFKRHQESSEDRSQQRGRDVSCLPQINNNSQVSCKAGLRCRNTGTHLGNGIKTSSCSIELICCLLASPCHGPCHQTLPSFSTTLPNRTRHQGSLPVPQGQDNHLGQDAVRLIPDGSDT